MYQVNSASLLSQLQADVRELILQATRLQELPSRLLETAPAPGSWSAAQAIDHLNIYAEYYVSAIEKSLHGHNSSPSVVFRAGWLGDYFTRLMKTDSSGNPRRKMKAPAKAIPAVSPDAVRVINGFIRHQHQLLNLLDICRHADLQKIRIPISINRYIRLRLGDTLRFVIAHQQRHMQQAMRAVGQGRESLFEKEPQVFVH